MKKLAVFAVATACFIGFSSFTKNEQEGEVLARKNIQLFAQKNISTFELQNQTLYKVEVLINNTQELQGVAKYEDLIPSGFTVSAIYADAGTASYDSEKAEVTFVNLQQKNSVKIVYYLESELAVTPISPSSFMYINGEDVDVLKIDPTVQ